MQAVSVDRVSLWCVLGFKMMEISSVLDVEKDVTLRDQTYVYVNFTFLTKPTDVSRQIVKGRSFKFVFFPLRLFHCTRLRS